MKKVDRIMGYKLGRDNIMLKERVSELEKELRKNNKDKAKLAYEQLKEKYKCAIWVEKTEFIDPEEEFK